MDVVVKLIKAVFWRGPRALVSRTNAFFDRHRAVYYSFVVVVFALAAAARGWAAPLSSGVDPPQFWAFAKVFTMYGLDFYKCSGGTMPIFPTQGWAFVYPPLWLLISTVSFLFVPGSLATSTMVDVSWRVAMKTPIIAADLAIGGLLLWAVPGSKLTKLLLTGLWLFHPTAWYNSAVFGQFDAIAAAFLLASVVLFGRGNNWLGFVFAGLAMLTKQHTAIPVLVMLAVLARQLPRRRLLTGLGIMAGMAVVVSLPFMFDGNLVPYLRAVFLPAQAASYQQPLVYAFNGPASLITYLHDWLGWNTEYLLRYDAPLLILAVGVVTAFAYLRRITIEQAALAGILVFIALFYRINYQYLVIYIPLAILALSRVRWGAEKALALALAVVPAAWVFLFAVTFWFNYLIPRNPEVVDPLIRAGLGRFMPDYTFVTIAMVIMALSVAYIVQVLAQGRKPPLTVGVPLTPDYNQQRSLS